MTCDHPFPDAAVFAFDPAPEPGETCVGALLDVAGEGAVVIPDDAVSGVLDLARARVGLGFGSGPAWARVRMSTVRSADEDNYLGIEGEAWVPVIDQAVVGGVWQTASLEAGIVPNPWITAGTRAWSFDALVPTFAESLGWMAPSDVGAAARVTGDGFDFVGTVTSGEGANRRERNEGKDFTGAFSIAPFDSPALVFTLFGRSGTYGLGSVRSNRVGGRVAGELERVAYGAELLKAWGIDEDAEREPLGGSAWARVAPIDPAFAFVRGDGWSEDPDEADASASQITGGLGAAEKIEGGRFYALLAVGHLSLGDAVAPFPGSPVGASVTTITLQVGLDAAFARTLE